MLGYGGHDDWRDMSEYLVHLTTAEPIDSIINEQTLLPGSPFGTARNLATIQESQYAVCLSEIPLDRLNRLVERHGTYGVGFRKTFIREHGGAPVWYLWRGSTAAQDFQKIVRDAMLGGIEPEEDLWKITPFIDNPGSGPWGTYEFDWEREWRVVGTFEFQMEDVDFLIAPEDTHQRLITKWSERPGNDLPPLIDLTWKLARLQEALAEYELSEDAVF